MVVHRAIPLAGLVACVLALTSARGAYDSGVAATGADLTVLRVTPEGADVPPGRQVVITFDRPVAPIGSAGPALAQAPAAISPPLDCHWHWIDPRALACELDEEGAMAPATTYRVTVAAGLKADDGAVLQSAHEATFQTERPALSHFSFRTWRSPGTPVVQLVFNHAVRKASVGRALKFPGGGATLVEPDPDDRELPWALPLPGEKGALLTRGVPAAKPDDRATTVDGDEARRVWLVSPASELGLDEEASLEIQPGLEAWAGDLRGAERRTVVAFDTFPEFAFVGVRCNGRVLSPGMECDPTGWTELMFSAPVIADEIKAKVRITPDLAGGRTDYDPWANQHAWSQLGQPHQRGNTYGVQLPELLKAFQAYTLEGLTQVEDEFGRRARRSDRHAFRTAHRPPRLALTHEVAVLEQGVDSHLPLYVTNLGAVDYRYHALDPAGTRRGEHRQRVAPAADISYAAPAAIRELLRGRSGVIVGGLKSDPPARKDSDRYPERFFAEVTPFQVHVKLGHYNTLAWVTRLADGTPVRDARVRIYADHARAPLAAPATLAEARTDAQGLALLPGRDTIDPGAQLTHESVLWGRKPGLMVRVDSGNDLALLPLAPEFAIETYRASRGKVWSAPMPRHGHLHAWGTTAQGVYRLGDTVQFKLYVRNEANRTLEPAPRAGWSLQVTDPTGKPVHEVPALTLDDFGAYHGEFKVPAAGAVGWYAFALAGVTPNSPLQPMRVLVADFTPAPFQVRTTLNGARFAPGDPVETATQATLHAGGPYAGAEARITARVSWRPLEAASPELARFEFQSVDTGAECWGGGTPAELTVDETTRVVDDRGELTTRFVMPDAGVLAGRLDVESAVRDERGKFVAARAGADYRGRDRYVGLHSPRWTYAEDQPATVQFAVIDGQGQAVAGVPVDIKVFVRRTAAARVKGAANAYLTSFTSTWDQAAACRGETAAGAPAECTFTPAEPGTYRVEATIHDTRGRPHRSQLCTWVTGKGRVLWEEPEDMSLTLVPEKPAYQVGERARFLVRNPFPGARALVTLERFGVMRSFVQTLEGSTPTIDVEVMPDDLPGFYLSVVVVSPRVAPPPGTGPLDDGGVDLGRPTYRVGYLQVPVNDPHKRLEVTVTPGRDTYKSREPVTVSLQARARAGAPAGKVEFAVAVLDEAVFDLIHGGTGYFDPYAGFYQLDPLDLENFGLLTRLVGLQKFEKKGANAGGDGGSGFDMRAVSKYIAYWNPSLRADADGRAQLEFTLPDNLTGWRVFALAVTPGDRLGLGDGKFRSSQATELRPVMPNQLTEGDEVRAGFSVLNRAERTRTLEVSIEASGAIVDAPRTVTERVKLAPFKRATVWLPLRAAQPGAITLRARARDSLDADALVHVVPVGARTSLDVAASYGSTLQDRVSETVVFPKAMVPGAGKLTVTAAPSVLGNLDGAFDYSRQFAYGCWEQRLTRALMASTNLRLSDYLAPEAAWPDAAAEIQTQLDGAASFQAPGGGMAFWVAVDERVSPYLSAYTALGFNRLRDAGYRVPADVETRLHAYLQRFLREDVKPTFWTEGMVSSVRAVALQALAERGALALAELERYRPHAPRMDLFGLAAFQRAAQRVAGGEPLAAELAKRILGHANQSGGKFQFTEPWDDGYVWLLATPLRSNCAILSALTHYGESAAGGTLVGDVPFKLAGTITASRGNRDHWENTQENVFCTLALADFAGFYEKEAPALAFTASLDGEALGRARFNAVRDPPVTLSRPNRAADAGRRATLSLERTGSGRVYHASRLFTALPDDHARPVNHGIEVQREYSVQRDGAWKLLPDPAQIRRGELVRVDLFVSLPAARHFVVVDDPVPGGLEPVNRDLATASTVDADQAAFDAAGGSFWFKYSDWSTYGATFWSFYHQELRHDAVRFYADYLPAGRYHLSYAAQAIAAGSFRAGPTHAEEMYHPDVYGKGLPLVLKVASD